jgi:hypothetical protein
LQYLTPCFSDDQAVEEQGEGIVLGSVPTYPWEGTDRDYKYEEVLKYFSANYFVHVNMDPRALVVSNHVTILCPFG